jgi:hypothetical protein
MADSLVKTNSAVAYVRNNDRRMLLPLVVRRNAKPLFSRAKAASRTMARISNVHLSVEESISPGAHVLANLNIPHQCQENWCWCAVALGIAKFFDSKIQLTQCQAVNAILPATVACSEPTNSNVNRPFRLEVAMQHFHNLRGSVLGPLTFEQIAQEIDDQKKPIAVGIKFLQTGLGHFAVIRGYDPSTRLLMLDDPSFGEAPVSFEELCRTYQGSGVWKASYLTKSAMA